MSLATKCMLLDLSLGVWEARKLDKLASKDVTTRNNAVAGSARVTKSLLPREAFAQVITARNALKAHFEATTLPWKRNGTAILMRNMYDLFMTKYSELEKDFNDAVTNFVDNAYPSARERASFNLAGLWNPDDYPHPDEIRHKFYVRLDIEPVPTVDDFRVQLDDAHMNQIKADLEEATNARLAEAMQGVWLRIAKVLEHYAKTMDQPDKTFRDSTVKNVLEVVDLLPGLNIMGDPNMRAIRRRLLDNLYQIEPDTLRKDESVRAAAAAEAQEILETMRGFCSQT